MARQSTLRSSERQHGFSKSARLLRTADYRKVYAEGKRRSLDCLVAFARANGKPASRVGLTVPRSLGGAVERNRLKRRLREAVGKHFGKLEPGWDIVLHPRSAAKSMNFKQMEEIIRKFFLACGRPGGGPAGA